MICASVPLCKVLAHIDATLGLEDDVPVSLRHVLVSSADAVDDGDSTEVVFLLTTRRAA
jgi:hypothetical protein